MIPKIPNHCPPQAPLRCYSRVSNISHSRPSLTRFSSLRWPRSPLLQLFHTQEGRRHGGTFHSALAVDPQPHSGSEDVVHSRPYPFHSSCICHAGCFQKSWWEQDIWVTLGLLQLSSCLSEWCWHNVPRSSYLSGSCWHIPGCMADLDPDQSEELTCPMK